MKRLLVLALLVTASPFSRAADTRLLDAIRSADSTAIRRVIQSIPPVDVRDASGATALMYAALYASVDDMRLLVDRGAEVNAATPTGATALMWAAYDQTRVRFLLDRGARVNARTRNNTTPLLVATRYGNVAAMRALISAGADVKNDAAALVAEAHARGALDVEQMLAHAGVETRDPRQLRGLLGGPNTLLEVGFPQRLLARGALLPADDIKTRTFSAPLLGYAVVEHGLPSVRMVLDRGADPNHRATHGITPIMMAAAAAEPDAAVIQLLIEHGADVSARDDNGRTALDWALLQGETAAAQSLRKAGAVAMAPPPPPPAPAAAPRTPRAAVEAALTRLQPAGPKFVEGAKCVSCHHETLPGIAVTVASTRGAGVDMQLARHAHDSTMLLWGPSRDELLLGRTAGISIGGFTGTAAYGLLGFAEERAAPNLLTDALALGVAAQQRADGSWNVGDIRPPLFDASPIHYTALAIRGIDAYMPAGRRSETLARIARGRQFLRTASSRHTQDEAFKLLGLVWSKAPNGEIARQRDRLLALQRADGGWGQRPTMNPDAYQTGQVLYALHQGGVAATDSAYQRGIQYLLRTQLDDGTWFMQSRAFAFQPYFETGFPHGTNQFISAAATAWATIALAYAI